MKSPIKTTNLPVLILGLGGLTLSLLILLYAFGTDQNGLLTAGNPLPVVILLLAILTITGTAVLLIGLKGSNRYADNFSASTTGAAGSFLAAAGVLYTAVTLLPDSRNPISVITVVLGFLSTAGLVLAGLNRRQGRRPFVGCHGILSLFFAMYLVCRYRVWSADPQLLDYGFCLCACVALMLHAYHHTAFDAGSGRRRRTLFSGLMSVYLCCAALASGEAPLLYLGCGAWALTNLCPLVPIRRRRPSSPQTPSDGEAG